MIDFNSNQAIYELNELRLDEELITSVSKCIDAQYQHGKDKLADYFRPNPSADHAVSEDALQTILENKEQISDIRTNTDLSNCIVFHTKQLDGSCISQEILDLRKRVDEHVAERVGSIFGTTTGLSVECSGHFWYPPGGYMGWHTNARKPGWRFYITHAETPGDSFFRYREPASGAVVTSVDREWDFRMFKICEERPFWHAVYSNTNRFSLGYMIRQQ